ncbi:MAG: tat (twin-arginine translocation) pathway signal sequence [Flavobacterium sp.]|nr:tat (twin-arginine translocation) pathway signal sequence [Flavobacterium sp.]
MDRRVFLKTGVTAGAALALGRYENLFANSVENIDMVAVKGGEPDIMLDKAIEAFGGMGHFVKKGQKVVIKPNIGWDVDPERAGNTNPKLVGRLIEHCYNAGAKEVYVFDHTCDDWKRCYATSGIEKAAKDKKATVVPGNTENYYQKVSIGQGKRLKETSVHELILSSDVFINVPVLKNHSSSKLSISMKNLMGVVWDRGYWHKNDLHQCIADFATAYKPTLNIIDAYNVMMKNGPRGVSKADVVQMKNLIITRDIVAADAAAARVFGMDPATVGHIKYASDMNIGKIDLSKLNIKRIIL